MQKLKTLYDAVKAADAEVARLQTEMLSAFELGTDEGKQKALDLRPQLDEARVKADEANMVYISARDADAVDPNAAARRFVPVGDNSGNKTAKTMSRAEFEQMSASDKMSFMLADGKISEDPA